MCPLDYKEYDIQMPLDPKEPPRGGRKRRRGRLKCLPWTQGGTAPACRPQRRQMQTATDTGMPLPRRTCRLRPEPQPPHRRFGLRSSRYNHRRKKTTHVGRRTTPAKITPPKRKSSEWSREEEQFLRRKASRNLVLEMFSIKIGRNSHNELRK